MKAEWRRFAPFGLALALLAALAAAGLYIVQREFSLAVQISLGLIVIGLALFVLLDPERTRQLLTGRQARYGSNALVMALAFIGILVVVNYLAYQNSQRWDLTEDQQFSLAEETINTIESLPAPVHATAFFSQRVNPDQAQGLLDQYAFYSNGKFDYSFVDPEADPVAAQQAEIAQDGTIVLTMDDQKQQVTTVSEQELTSALIRLRNPEARKVYFLTGHGERSIDTSAQDSYSIARRVLVSKNYTVEPLNLLATNSIPDDAKVIVIAGPTNPLSQDEVTRLAEFLELGGGVIVMQEPTPFTDFGDAPDPLADYLTQTWGITLGNDVVVDLSSNQPFLAVGSQYGTNPIVSDLSGLVSVMPTARSVSVGQAAGVAQDVLLSTSDQAWAETDLEALQTQDAQVQADEGVDLIGPVPLGVAAEHFSTTGRLVVFGDADFAADAYFTAYANGDLFVNSVDWAMRQEALINLTPKNNTQRLLLPPQAMTMNLILLGTVFILPGLALVAGVTAWAQKRRRG